MANPISSNNGNSLFDLLSNLNSDLDEGVLDAASLEPQIGTQVTFEDAFARALGDNETQSAPAMLSQQSQLESIAKLSQAESTRLGVTNPVANDIQGAKQPNLSLTELMFGVNKPTNVDVTAQALADRVAKLQALNANLAASGSAQSNNLAPGDLKTQLALLRANLAPTSVENPTALIMEKKNLALRDDEFDDSLVEQWPGVETPSTWTKDSAALQAALALGVQYSQPGQEKHATASASQLPTKNRALNAIVADAMQPQAPHATPAPHTVDDLKKTLAAMGMDAEVTFEDLAPTTAHQSKNFLASEITRPQPLSLHELKDFALRPNAFNNNFGAVADKTAVTAPLVLTQPLGASARFDEAKLAAALQSDASHAAMFDANLAASRGQANPRAQGMLHTLTDAMSKQANSENAALSQALSNFALSDKTKMLDDKASELDAKLLDKLAALSAGANSEQQNLAAGQKDKQQIVGTQLVSEDLLRPAFRKGKGSSEFGESNDGKKEKLSEKEDLSMLSVETASGSKMWIGEPGSAPAESTKQNHLSPISNAALDKARNLASQMQGRGGVAKVEIKDNKNGAINLEIRVEPGNRVFVEVKSRDSKLKDELQDGLESLKKSLESQKLTLSEFKFTADAGGMNSNTNSGGQNNSKGQEQTGQERPSYQQFTSQHNSSGGSDSGFARQHSQQNGEQFADRMISNERAKNFERNASASSNTKTNVQRSANGSLKVSA